MSTGEQEQVTERVVIPLDNGVVLKQLFIEDARPMKALIDYDRKHLLKYGEDTGSKYMTEEELIRSIVFPNDESRLRLAIWDKDTMVGSVNLQPRQEAVAEVGYWVGKEYIGHGYAATAVRGISDYAFGQGYALLFGKVHPDNIASQKTLENAGYKFNRWDETEDGDKVAIYELSN